MTPRVIPGVRLTRLGFQAYVTVFHGSGHYTLHDNASTGSGWASRVDAMAAALRLRLDLIAENGGVA